MLYMVRTTLWVRKLDYNCCNEETIGSHRNVVAAQDDEGAVDSKADQLASFADGWDVKNADDHDQTKADEIPRSRPAQQKL